MKRILLYILTVTALTSCHDITEPADNSRGVFETLWKTLDEHYCFFREKGIDWDSVYNVYSPLVTEDLSSQRLFDVCSDMVNCLRDGHTNLSSPFATSYYRKFWSDYPQNYDARIVQQNYFNFNYRSLGAFDYGILPENVGYIHYSTFQGGFGAGNMDYILAYFAGVSGLIFDVRDNGGGNLDNVEDIANRFVRERSVAGYILHKTGPGHDDFSEPFAYYIDPVEDGHIAWRKPVVVLTNRSTFSAANNFVSVMKNIPGVKIIGARTGGGSGMPFNSELPNGWAIRFSAVSILDAQGVPTENGIEPSEGFAVEQTAADIAAGIDPILDRAIAYLTSL